MHNFCLPLLIALSITTLEQNPPAPKVVPLRIQNGGYGALTVKVVGPDIKTLKLGYGENQVILVTPGEYFCLYRFKGEPSEPLVFKKTGKFQVPTPAPDKPMDQVTVFAAQEDHDGQSLTREVREVKPSSATEFNAGATAPMLANPQPESTLGSADSLRLNSLNLVMFVEEIFYGETAAQKRIHKNRVVNQLNQYVRGVLIPKLTKQGFKVRNLGLLDDDSPDDYSTEPTLVIDYSESEGQAYTMYAGYGEPSVYGVEISCSLRIDHPAVLPGLGIWHASLTAGNDESIKMNFFSNKEVVLHNQALKYLREQLNDLALDLSDWAPRGAATPGPAAAAAGTANPVTPGPRRTPRRRSSP